MNNEQQTLAGVVAAALVLTVLAFGLWYVLEGAAWLTP